MNAYYVMSPYLPQITSVVYGAPSTEKARTTFLDYLERSKQIERYQRSLARRDMVAEKLEDPESIPSSVTLHYGYREGPTYRMGLGHSSLPSDSSRSYEPIEEEFDFEPESSMDPDILEPVEEPQERRLSGSPIQNLALGRF